MLNAECPMPTDRVFRAGDEVEDLCRACKTDRSHTVIVVDNTGWPLRVQCGFCQSQHNYRGGPRTISNPQVPTPKLTPNSKAPISSAAEHSTVWRVSVGQRSRKDRTTHVASGSF